MNAPKTAICRICGRLLTNPASVEREIGPRCFEKLQKEIKTVEKEDGRKQ